MKRRFVILDLLDYEIFANLRLTFVSSSNDYMTRYRELSVRQLVEQEVCPPWYLTSTPVLGRCLPFKLNSTDTEDKKEVSKDHYSIIF